jgi:magnesium-transporting ATPase (P-type)
MPTELKQSLDLGELAGLSEKEAQQRLEKQGPNELPVQKGHSLLAVVLEVVREPMFIMLIVAGSLYLLLGDPNEALMLLGFVFVVMGGPSVRCRPCRTCRARGRSSFGTKSTAAFRGARSFLVICWCLPKVTACRRILSFVKESASRRTNRC